MYKLDFDKDVRRELTVKYVDNVSLDRLQLAAIA